MAHTNRSTQSMPPRIVPTPAPPRSSRGGGSSSVALLVLLPVVTSLILGLMQLGVTRHGTQTAQAAAQAAAEAERVLQPTQGGGTAAATRVADQGGLTDVVVNITRTATTVTVSVTGRAPVLFTVGDIDVVTATITVPKERLS